MKCITSNILSALIFVGAACFLLPTTLVYAFMMIFVVGGFVANIANWDIENLKTATAVLLFFALPGYGLYSLWWLVVMHRIVVVRNVPKWVWGGVLVGCLMALAFNPSVLSGKFSFRVDRDAYLGLVVAGGGALLVVVPLLCFMLLGRKGAQSE